MFAGTVHEASARNGDCENGIALGRTPQVRVNEPDIPVMPVDPAGFVAHDRGRCAPTPDLSKGPRLALPGGCELFLLEVDALRASIVASPSPVSLCGWSPLVSAGPPLLLNNACG